MDYRLTAQEDFITSRLEVDVTGEDWSRRLVLTRDGAGSWRAGTRSAGDPGLPEPGGDMERVKGAIDCDLGL